MKDIRKHMKKIVCTAMTVVMTMTVIPSYTADAASYADLQAKRKNLSASTASAKKEIAKLKDKKLSLQDEMSVLDKALTSMQAERDAAQEELDYLTERLHQAEKELQEATEKRDAQFELLGSRMQFLQEKGSSGYFEILLDSESFSDLFLRMQYVNDIMGYDKEILNELEQLQKTIQTRKAEIEKNRKEQEQVVAVLQAKVDEMNGIVKQKESVMASYEKDLAKYEQMVKANAAADAAALRQMNALSSPTVVYKGSGSFAWPAPGGRGISSEFGSRTSPISGKSEFHNGLDIPANYGSPIVAAESGTVTYAGWMNGYGNTIIIDHGSGLTTLYGHNSSLVVSRGQKVSKGQQIARCGSTGWSTGNHCHFTVSKNGVAVNPHSYVG